jgi:hypothetical protein
MRGKGGWLATAERVRGPRRWESGQLLKAGPGPDPECDSLRVTRKNARERSTKIALGLRSAFRYGATTDLARINRRSLQQEMKEILKRAVGMPIMREARRLSERWRHRLRRRSFSDSARLIREDRDSR